MPDLTLVRLFQHNDRVANVLVDDWADTAGRARFTLPIEHPRGRWLMDAAQAATASAIVMSTDEVEWMIDSVTTPVRRDVPEDHRDHYRKYFRIDLMSRTRRIRESQPNDAYSTSVFGIEARLFAITAIGERIPVDFEYTHTGLSGRRYWTLKIDDTLAEIMPSIIAFDGIALPDGESLFFPEPGIGWNTPEWGNRIMANSRHVFKAYDNREAN